MKKLIITAALLSAAFAAQAGTEIVVHGISHHTSARHAADGKPWNQVNSGVAFRGYSGDFSVQAGLYKNSIYKTSYYAMADYTPLSIGPVAVGAFGGAATGYEGGGVMPVAGAVVRYQADAYSITLRAAPRFRASKSGVFALEGGFKF